MKRVFKIALAAVMMVLCMSMVSFAQEKTVITDGDQLLDVFKYGGYAVLEDNITTKRTDLIEIRDDAMIDLNGHNIILLGGDYTVYGNVCFMNGTVSMEGKVFNALMGTVAVKNGLLNMSQLDLRIGSRADILKVGEDAYVVVAPEYYKSPIMTLTVDGELISGEMFMDMAITGDLPELKKNGYSFEGWKALPGNVVTNWKEATNTDLIRATWSEKTASIFGGGGIWMILTFIFFISTVVLAIMYKKKK